jgi:hypothetical protein
MTPSSGSEMRAAFGSYACARATVRDPPSRLRLGCATAEGQYAPARTCPAAGPARE